MQSWKALTKNRGPGWSPRAAAYPLPPEVVETAPLWRRRAAAFRAALQRVGFGHNGHGTWLPRGGEARKRERGCGDNALRALAMGIAARVGFVRLDDGSRRTMFPSLWLDVVDGAAAGEYADPWVIAVVARGFPREASCASLAVGLDVLGDTLTAAALLAQTDAAAFAPVYELITEATRDLANFIAWAPTDIMRFRPDYRRGLILAGYPSSTRGW